MSIPKHTKIALACLTFTAIPIAIACSYINANISTFHNVQLSPILISDMSATQPWLARATALLANRKEHSAAYVYSSLPQYSYSALQTSAQQSLKNYTIVSRIQCTPYLNVFSTVQPQVSPTFYSLVPREKALYSKNPSTTAPVSQTLLAQPSTSLLPSFSSSSSISTPTAPSFSLTGSFITPTIPSQSLNPLFDFSCPPTDHPLELDVLIPALDAILTPSAAREFTLGPLTFQQSPTQRPSASSSVTLSASPNELIRTHQALQAMLGAPTSKVIEATTFNDPALYTNPSAIHLRITEHYTITKPSASNKSVAPSSSSASSPSATPPVPDAAESYSITTVTFATNSPDSPYGISLLIEKGAASK